MEFGLIKEDSRAQALRVRKDLLPMVRCVWGGEGQGGQRGVLCGGESQGGAIWREGCQEGQEGVLRVRVIQGGEGQEGQGGSLRGGDQGGSMRGGGGQGGQAEALRGGVQGGSMRGEEDQGGQAGALQGSMRGGRDQGEQGGALQDLLQDLLARALRQDEAAGLLHPLPRDEPLYMWDEMSQTWQCFE